MSVHHEDSRVTLHHGDCLDVLRSLPDASVDSVVCDPPYGLEFMGKSWDGSDGFRRSLNAADAGRDNAFGRASRTSPEYRAGALFQQWCEAWAAECLRVLKPGGHLLAFGGTRTWHRLACAVEDAGFEVRDSIAWLYGSGFPKSLDVSKAIDKAARGVPQGGSDPTSPNHGKFRTTTTEGKRWDNDSGQGYGAGGSRFLADGMASDSGTGRAASGVAAIAPEAETWAGWGTALKPAFEPVVVARKPLAGGTVAANVLTHGTGALNVDGCRIDAADDNLGRPSGNGGFLLGGVSTLAELEALAEAGGSAPNGAAASVVLARYWRQKGHSTETPAGGRWPANVILDEDMAGVLDQMSGNVKSGGSGKNSNRTALNGNGLTMGHMAPKVQSDIPPSDGGASRFFYVAKAPKRERPVVDGVAHPTVKPLALMRWLVRLVTPPGGTVLEPFAGSGTTVEACLLEGFRCIAIEKGDEYLPLILERIARQDRARIEAEVVRTVDVAAAIAEQVAGQLDIFGEDTA